MTEAVGNEALKIISTIPLTDREKELALGKAKKFLGVVRRVEYEIDPNILGGLIFKTKDKILNLSIAEKLNQIKNLLDE